MKNIKKIAFYILPLLLTVFVFTASVSAQTRQRKPVRQTAKATSATRSKTTYYISVGRANVGQFSNREWQKVADKFKRSGVPAFFAETESLPLSVQSRSEWLLVKMNRRLKRASVDALLLGPFASREKASAAVRKFPELFSDEGSPLREDHFGSWSMGYFLIMGVGIK